MKKFVALRQDLERVRNLSYMVSRREKLQRSLIKMREQVFEKQLSLVMNSDHLSLSDVSAVMEANHGPTLYDRVFSHRDAEEHSEQDFEVIISTISGEISSKSGGQKQDKKDNPYRTPKIQTPKMDPNKGLAYKRMFDSSASETEDILNPNASAIGRRGRRKNRGDSSAGASDSEAASSLASPPPASRKSVKGKKAPQTPSTKSNKNNKKQQPPVSKKHQRKAAATSSSGSEAEEDAESTEEEEEVGSPPGKKNPTKGNRKGGSPAKAKSPPSKPPPPPVRRPIFSSDSEEEKILQV